MAPAPPKVEFKGLYLFIVKSACGVGVLGMPSAFRRSGWLLGTIMTLAVSAGITAGLFWLTRAKTLLERHGYPVSTYRDVAFVLLGGEIGACATELAIVTMQLGTCMVYFLFLGDTLALVLSSALTAARYELVFALPAGVLCAVRYMRDLARIAELSSVLYAVSTFAIACYLAVRVATHGVAPGGTLLETRSLGYEFGVFVFAFESFTNVIMQVHNSMAEPERINELIVASSLTITVAYLSLGLLGYAAYGSPQNPVSYSLLRADDAPLADGGANAGPALICLVQATSVLLSFPLQFFPAITILEVREPARAVSRRRHYRESANI